jgi:hypothetical protein
MPGNSPGSFVYENIKEVELAPLRYYDVIDAYLNKKNYVMWTPNGYLYSYEGELGISISLEIGGTYPIYFSTHKIEKGLRSFIPTLPIRRYYGDKNT